MVQEKAQSRRSQVYQVSCSPTEKRARRRWRPRLRGAVKLRVAGKTEVEKGPLAWVSMSWWRRVTGQQPRYTGGSLLMNIKLRSRLLRYFIARFQHCSQLCPFLHIQIPPCRLRIAPLRLKIPKWLQKKKRRSVSSTNRSKLCKNKRDCYSQDLHKTTRSRTSVWTQHRQTFTPKNPT